MPGSTKNVSEGDDQHERLGEMPRAASCCMTDGPPERLQPLPTTRRARGLSSYRSGAGSGLHPQALGWHDRGSASLRF